MRCYNGLYHHNLYRAYCAWQVNKSPFDNGWLMKVKMSDSSQLDSLMDTSAYKSECESH